MLILYDLIEYNNYNHYDHKLHKPNDPPAVFMPFLEKYGRQASWSSCCTIISFMAHYQKEYSECSGPEEIIDERFKENKYVKRFIEEIPSLGDYIIIEDNKMKYSDLVSEEAREEIKKYIFETDKYATYYTPLPRHEKEGSGSDEIAFAKYLEYKKSLENKSSKRQNY